MRKIFASAFGVAVIGATLFGAVYAWTATNTQTGSASVGTASLTVTLVPTANYVGPDNGLPVTVATGSINNTGNFALTLTGGSLVVTSANPSPICAPSDFSDPDTGVVITIAGPVPALGTGGAFNANIATNVGAPEDCQGDSLGYTVTINATT